MFCHLGNEFPTSTVIVALDKNGNQDYTIHKNILKNKQTFI
jgi:hypothetical protein